MTDRNIVGGRALVACRWCGELHDCFSETCGCGIKSYAEKREYEAWVAGGRQGEWKPSKPLLSSKGQKLLGGKKGEVP